MLGFHLLGQRCAVCKEEIRPSDRFHTLDGEPGRPVQFVHAEECPICVSEEKNSAQQRLV